MAVLMGKNKDDKNKTKAELTRELEELRKQNIALKISETKRKQAERALWESEEKYKSLVNQLPVGVYRTTKDGKFLHVNPALATILEFENVEELLMVNARDFHHESIQRLNQIKKWEKEKGILSEEIRLQTKTGKIITVKDTGKAILDKNGEIQYFDGAIEDITDRKRAEEEKAKLEEQLLQAQKMEALGTLAGGIAHDFNNILGVIMGFTELVFRRLPEHSAMKKNLQKVLDSSEHAKQMVQQILMFSRKSQKEMKPLNIGKIVKETVKFLRSSIPVTIEIRSHIAKNLKPVLAVESQINQVLMNICTNAAYAMREAGGLLEISLEEINIDLGAALKKELAPGTYQQLTIRDTGCGMNPQVLKRMFEPYYTTKGPGEGTGLGLSVAHGIVKSHKGAIMVDSEPGKGTRFDVFLPTVKEIDTIIEKADPEEPIPAGNERILLVEDNQNLLGMSKQMLEDLGYEVTPRTSSVEALEYFKVCSKKVDLLVTDMTMPNMTGVQLAREIHKIRPGFPVILCTGFSDRISEENYQEQGINGFVMKPMTRRDIGEVIRKVLDKK